jgi:hypothetical protein
MEYGQWQDVSEAEKRHADYFNDLLLHKTVNTAILLA